MPEHADYERLVQTLYEAMERSFLFPFIRHSAMKRAVYLADVLTRSDEGER